MNSCRSVLFILCLSLAALSVPSEAGAANWYVDADASGGGNGSSWSTAWNGLAAISWPALAPGDTIYVSGGSTSKAYGVLAIGASGASGRPITIRVGLEPNHRGTVRLTHINTNNESWITINGEVDGQRRIEVSNPSGTGIYTGPGDDIGLVLAYLTVANSGNAYNQHGIQIRGVVSDSEIVGCAIHDNYQDGINLYAGGAQGAYGRVKIHHNLIHDNGDDGIQGGRGMEIYANVIHDQSNWSIGHPDGIQISGGGDYTQIYGNTIYNFTNAAIFNDPGGGGSSTTSTTFRHVRIYNNAIFKDTTSPPFDTIGVMRGIILYGDSGGTINFDDVVIANNTVVDMDMWGIDVKYRTGGKLSNAIVANNLVYNCYTSAPSSGSALSVRMSYDPVGDNVQLRNNLVNAGSSGSQKLYWHGASYTDTSANNAANSSGNTFAAPAFVGYAPGAADQELQLAGSDAAARDKGFGLSTHFSTDHDGMARPAGAAWDIGAYEALAGAACAAFGGQCCAAGELCEAGSFTPSSDCGSQCCVGGSCAPVPETCKSQGFVCCQACAGASNSAFDADCPGQVCCDACALPIFAPDECIEAEAGELVAPMESRLEAGASAGTYVAGGVSNQGAVTFELDVQQDGQYVLFARVQTPAPSDAHDSFYVGLDDAAVSGLDEHVYDAAASTTYGWDPVSLRGLGGTPTASLYEPMVWSLSAGSHSFTFWGRERDTRLDQVALLRCPAGADCAALPPPTCQCEAGATRSCYDGPAMTEDVGACHGGLESCAAGSWGSCVGQVLPATEICGDGLDNDCDGLVDNADELCAASCADADADGAAEASCGGTDCNDADATIHPDAAEICSDGVDNDCDGADTLCEIVSNPGCGCRAESGRSSGSWLYLALAGLVLAQRRRALRRARDP